MSLPYARLLLLGTIYQLWLTTAGLMNLLKTGFLSSICLLIVYIASFFVCDIGNYVVSRTICDLFYEVVAEKKQDNQDGRSFKRFTLNSNIRPMCYFLPNSFKHGRELAAFEYGQQPAAVKYYYKSIIISIHKLPNRICLHNVKQDA